MTEKFLITYKYNPEDLIFVCEKIQKLEYQVGNPVPVQIEKYKVVTELTSGHEGDTRYKGIEFRLDDGNVTAEVYNDKYKIDIDQMNYLKRLGL